MRRALAGALIALCCLLLQAPAAAQEGKHKEDLDRIRREIRQLRGKLKSVRAREKSVETDLEAVEDYETGDFDITVFWYGKRFDGSLPRSVRLFISEGPSGRGRETFDTGTDSRPYANESLGVIDAIVGKTRKAKEDVGPHQLLLDSAKIPKDRHFFKLAHKTNYLVFSQDVFQAISSRSLKGIAAKRLREVQ